MRILIVHNRYQQVGGEDTVVEAEHRLLESHGNEVELFMVDNRDLVGGVVGQVCTALSTAYSKSSKESVKERIRDFKPDIVHVHNFFPQLSPSIYDACIGEKVPVVQTLHNYRLICPGALLTRNGQICEKCITGSPYQAALHKCYKNSHLGSLVVADMVAKHRKSGTWNNKVDRFIALTEFAKSKFLQAGFSEEKICVKPNFIEDPLINVQSKDLHLRRSESPFALFVGRLSVEKGVSTLIKGWSKLEQHHTLKLAGNGPLVAALPKQKNFDALGFLSSAEISELMCQALFLVLPSEWYEGFPMVIVEAFAHGLPILASRIGSLEEIIDDGETGAFYEVGNDEDLSKKARWLLEHPKECHKMGINARNQYMKKFTSDVNYTQLFNIYNTEANN